MQSEGSMWLQGKKRREFVSVYTLKVVGVFDDFDGFPDDAGASLIVI
jgi:hypothetical protein